MIDLQIDNLQYDFNYFQVAWKVYYNSFKTYSDISNIPVVTRYAYDNLVIRPKFNKTIRVNVIKWNLN